MKDFLSPENLRFCVEYDYTSDNHNCTCQDICRCSVITNAKITDASSLIPHIMNDLPKNIPTIHRYAIGRICTFCQLWKPELYDLDIDNGYYGQEVSGVSIDSQVRSKFNHLLAKFTKTKVVTKITKELLIEEYGHLLNCLKSVKFSIKTIDVLSISAGSDTHYRKVSQETLSHYKENKENKDKKLPQGVVLKLGKNYRLIDGYHRFITALKSNKTELPMIVGS